MIAYIINGSSFGNCVDYVTRRTLEEKLGKDAEKRQKADERKYEANNGEDIIDHLSKDWELIGSSADIRLYEGRKAMADDISRPTRRRKPIKDPVGHISLDFHPKDAPNMTNERMAEIASDYIRQMGLDNTPLIIVRHFDKAHPHCHLVFSRVDYDGKILTQTTNFKKNERVCKALNKKYGLHIGKDKLHTDVSKLRGKEKVRYQVTHDIARCYPVATDWNSYLAVLRKCGITTKEKVSRRGNVNLYYCKGGYEFWSKTLHKNLDRNSLECYFKVKRQQTEGQTVQKPTVAERPKLQQSKPQSKPIAIPPLPDTFMWGMLSDKDRAAYQRGETVCVDIRPLGEYWPREYWIWHDFNTGKPCVSYDPPKGGRNIPQGFLQQIASSGLRLFTPSSGGDASNDGLCIAHGEPVSGDFKQFLENHPDLDFYAAKRKFKEEQKAKARVRQGPKLH